MSNNKKRVQKLEGRTGTGEGLIDKIVIQIVKADGSPGGQLISKLVDGKWTQYEKQA